MDSRKPIDWLRYGHLSAEGLTQRQIAPQLGISQGWLSRLLKSRKAVESNGAPGAPESAPKMKPRQQVMVHPSAPDSAPRLETIEQRLSVVEAFIATLQDASYRPSAPNGAPECTLKRGFVIGAALSRQIDAYADAHHVQVKQILDAALREFFARRGWPAEELEG